MAMVMSMTNKHEKFSKPESFFLMAPGDCTNDVLGHATAGSFLSFRIKKIKKNQVYLVINQFVHNLMNQHRSPLCRLTRLKTLSALKTTREN